MAQQDTWPIAHAILMALGEKYSPAMEKVAQDAGLDAPERSLLITALAFDPQPVASWRLRVRSPYTATGRYEERLRKASRLGFFRAAREGEYVLTELGRNTARRLIDAAYEAMAKQKPMPKADLERLAVILGRLVEACVAVKEPPGKWSLTLSRKTDPGDTTPALVRVEQYLRPGRVPRRRAPRCLATERSERGGLGDFDVHLARRSEDAGRPVPEARAAGPFARRLRRGA